MLGEIELKRVVLLPSSLGERYITYRFGELKPGMLFVGFRYSYLVISRHHNRLTLLCTMPGTATFIDEIYDTLNAIVFDGHFEVFQHEISNGN
jgi:hypothetical protein